jgi:hypothetical protein
MCFVPEQVKSWQRSVAFWKFINQVKSFIFVKHKCIRTPKLTLGYDICTIFKVKYSYSVLIYYDY